MALTGIGLCFVNIQVYYINLEDMQTALDTFTLHPSLLYRLWRVIAIRIATPLMLEQIAFQVYTVNINSDTYITTFVKDTGHFYDSKLRNSLRCLPILRYHKQEPLKLC